ncbi:hypothetical protein BH11PAT4_BH11PAT4_6330 [soil metagenome]
MSTETGVITVLHSTVYRVYEYFVLGGLVITVVGAVICNQLNIALTAREAEWVSRGLFAACFFGSYYMVRQPELLARVSWEQSVQRQKLLLLKSMAGFMPTAILIVYYKELLVTKPEGAVVAAGMLCFTWGYMLYHRALADGVITQPAVAYWGVISLIDVLSLGASLRTTGWSIGSIQLLCWTLGASSVLGAIIWRARGSVAWQPSLTDRLCAAVSILAMLIWLVGSPTLALAALAVAMAAACVPLVVSAAQGREVALPLAPFALGGLTGIFSVASWSQWQNWVIPVIGLISFGGVFLFAAVVKKQHGS